MTQSHEAVIKDLLAALERAHSLLQKLSSRLERGDFAGQACIDDQLKINVAAISRAKSALASEAESNE